MKKTVDLTEDVFVTNIYNEDKEYFNLLKKDLRNYLNVLVKRVLDKYNIVSNYKLDSNDGELIDPTIYTGAAGVLYSL